jgi:imidazolonepropionase-like amidohydrolase
MPGRTRADMMLDYLSVWRAAGISPAEILKSMTSEPAQLLRVADARGRLAVGQHADLIGLPADPLVDIENLRRVDFVMKDGRVVRRAGSSVVPP